MNKSGYIFNGMEHFGASSKPPLKVCLDAVKNSDIFVGILGTKYGSCPNNNKLSYTEREYHHARSLGKGIIMFLIDERNAKIYPKDFEVDTGKMQRLTRFKTHVRNNYQVGWFTTEDNLAWQVLASLKHYNSEPVGSLSLKEFIEILSTLRPEIADILGHGVRVEMLASLISSRLGLPHPERDLISNAALLHDFGKLRITDDILKKSGPLTNFEYSKIKSHPQLILDIINMLPNSKLLEGIILAHHELMDGSGYPKGIKHEEIPLGARIISVVDTFDSLTYPRPYRRAFSTKATLKEIEIAAKSGKLDKDVVSTLKDIIL